MTDFHAQQNYQVRLSWGESALSRLAPADIVVVVDAIGSSPELAAKAAAQANSPLVFTASLRNATATAQAIVDEQVARNERTSINLVLAGDEEGRFAVEDYLAAGAIADALTNRGLDHSSPEAAVAAEGFRPLTRAVKHLFSASAAGLKHSAEGRKDEVRAAAEFDAEPTATRYSAN